MSPTLDAFLRSWPFDPWLLVALAAHGRRLPARLARAPPPRPAALARRPPRRVPRRAGGDLPGPGVADRAVRGLLLQVHMVQHLLLMMVAPPLLWLGAPLFPLLRGLPRPVRIYWVAPLLSLAAAAPALRPLDAPAAALAALRRRHLALARPAASTTWPCARAAGTTCSTLLPRHGARCSGIPSSGPIPAGRAGRPGCCCPYLSWPTCRTRSCRPCSRSPTACSIPYYAEVPRLAGLSAAGRPGGGRRAHVGARLAWRSCCRCSRIGVRLLSGRESSVRGVEASRGRAAGRQDQAAPGGSRCPC